jgi:phosphatidate cytidylyltransferase
VADDQPADGPVTSTTVPPRSDLGLRVVSSLVLAPLALGAAYLGGWMFAAFWGIAAIGVLVEWGRIVGEARRAGVMIAGVLALAAATILAAQRHCDLALLAIGIGMVAAAALATGGRRVWNAAGVAYAGAIAVAPIILRADSTLGLTAVVVIFAVVWATDILGYCVGRVIGGAKLAASISPKKTWSGSIGGTLGAVLAILAIAAYAHLQNLAILGFLAVILSVASQAGDLCESAIKRRFGVKDASHIIPGHGGLMDRLDGFVAAASLAALIGVARGGFDAAGRGLLTW